MRKRYNRIIMMRIKNKNNRLPLVSAAIVAVLLIGGGLAYWQRDTIGSWFGQPSENTTSDDSSSDSADSDSADNPDSDMPSTDSDGTSSNSNSSDESSSSPDSDGTRQVTVIINDASQYDSNVEVRSYVEGIVETSGTCTITFTKGSQSFARTTEPLTNPNYTTCAAISVPVSDFPSKGTWQVTVDYLSAQYKGSASTHVEVK